MRQQGLIDIIHMRRIHLYKRAIEFNIAYRYYLIFIRTNCKRKRLFHAVLKSIGVNLFRICFESYTSIRTILQAQTYTQNKNRFDYFFR